MMLRGQDLLKAHFLRKYESYDEFYEKTLWKTNFDLQFSGSELVVMELALIKAFNSDNLRFRKAAETLLKKFHGASQKIIKSKIECI